MVVATRTAQRTLFPDRRDTPSQVRSAPIVRTDRPITRRESLMDELRPLMNPANPQQTLVSVIDKALGDRDATKLFDLLKRKFTTRITTDPQLFFQKSPNFLDDAPCTLKALGTQLNGSDKRLEACFTQIEANDKLESLVNLFINVEDLLAKVSAKHRLPGTKRDRSSPGETGEIHQAVPTPINRTKYRTGIESSLPKGDQ